VDDAITALLQQQGRRVVLVFTDGVDSPATFSYGNKLSKEVIKRAEEEDVMVYGIGLAGQNAASGGRGVFGGPGRAAGGWGGATFGRNETGKPDEGLKKIANETGGGYFELTSTDDLPATFRRVADELHHQYVLGFAPPMLDGKMHKLEVRVQGAASVRARKSYRASRD
jgi:VWFA-related protein